VSRTASQTEVLLVLAPRIDAPPDLVDDSDDDERPVVLAGAAMWPSRPVVLAGAAMWPSLFQDSDNDLGARSPISVGHRLWESPLMVHGGSSFSGLRSFEAPRIHHFAFGEMMPELIDDSDDDEMPALVADDPSYRGTCRSPAWGCAKPGRQG
jgi:hypothetical protein